MNPNVTLEVVTPEPTLTFGDLPPGRFFIQEVELPYVRARNVKIKVRVPGEERGHYVYIKDESSNGLLCTLDSSEGVLEMSLSGVARLVEKG